MSEGRTTIGLTSENQDTIDDIMPFFEEQMDAAKFAMSLAIEEDVEIGKVGNAETIWNIGSFDPEGEIADLIEALHPDANDPYEVAQFLINEGLVLIENHLQENKELAPEKLI